MEKTINDRITELIERLELTPNAFATQIGVKTTIIYNIQKGRNKPGYDILKKITERYNINANWLLTGVGEIGANGLINYHKNDISNVNLNLNNDVNLNGKNDVKPPQNPKDYMRLVLQQSMNKHPNALANYYTNDPIGRETKRLLNLKEKYMRRFDLEAAKEDEKLLDLSKMIDYLGDTIDMIMDVYLNNINNRPDPFETSQYFDLQNNSVNIPDTVDYNKYKESVIKWLESIRVYEPVINEYYKQSLAFLESISKEPNSGL